MNLFKAVSVILIFIFSLNVFAMVQQTRGSSGPYQLQSASLAGIPADIKRICINTISQNPNSVERFKDIQSLKNTNKSFRGLVNDFLNSHDAIKKEYEKIGPIYRAVHSQTQHAQTWLQGQPPAVLDRFLAEYVHAAHNKLINTYGENNPQLKPRERDTFKRVGYPPLQYVVRPEEWQAHIMSNEKIEKHLSETAGVLTTLVNAKGRVSYSPSLNYLCAVSNPRGVIYHIPLACQIGKFLLSLDNYAKKSCGKDFGFTDLVVRTRARRDTVIAADVPEYFYE